MKTHDQLITDAEVLAEVEANGFKYRCLMMPEVAINGGIWQFWYNGKWHEMKNHQIRTELNRAANFKPFMEYAKGHFNNQFTLNNK